MAYGYAFNQVGPIAQVPQLTPWVLKGDTQTARQQAQPLSMLFFIFASATASAAPPSTLINPECWP
jgi:hypothetical protein